MHVLHDGDVLLYQAGFASDANARREVQDKLGIEDKSPAWAAYTEEHGKPFELLENCLHLLKLKIIALNERLGARSHTIYLSHPVNRREQLFPEYKANRDPTRKPHWYAEMQDYLLNKGALYSKEGDEADDALGIAQMELLRAGKPSLICTIDKDLDMIPGMHYNYSPTKWETLPYEVDELSASRFFYKQLLTGDSTDNIPGLYRITGKRMNKAILGPIDQLDRDRDMYEHVLGMYAGDEKQVELLAHLLWIKRTNDNWRAPQ